MVFLMIRNIVLSTTLLSAALALSMLAKADFGSAPAFAQTTPKMHLDEGIKALKSGDNQGAMMHLNAAEQALGGTSSTSTKFLDLYQQGLNLV